MGAMDLLVITICHNVSFMGKVWWTVMLVLRLLVLLLAGIPLFSDEQDRFICNTIQPGCSNVCFNVFAPVSVFRLWIFHLILLFLPHLLFATYVLHKVLSYYGRFCYSRSLENSRSSRELSLHKAPLHDPPREWAVPRFHCAYFLVVILRILLEVVFGAGQFFLFGLTIPTSFLCYEAPCTSGVQCYISRPTEKTLMLNFMLGLAALSVLFSLMDLVSSMKAMVTWRSKREMLMEEMSKVERSSMLTSTTTTEDRDVLLTRRTSPSGSSKTAAAAPNTEAPPPMKVNVGTMIQPAESTNDKKPESKDSPVPTHSVPHNHLRPPLSPRLGRGSPPIPRVPTPMGVKKLVQSPPTGANSGHQSDSGESQDKRAWV